MTHAEFVAAYQRGEIKVDFDPKTAERFLSARLLLPLIALPVLGIGVALTLIGWVYTGLAIIAAGFIGPRLIKRGAPRFILAQALQERAFYEEVTRSGLMKLTAVV